VSSSSGGGAGAGVTSLACHPSQAHILLAGQADGVLAVWDLRSAAQPATLLQADKSAVSCVVFHPDQPDHLFSCSQAGEVCHWSSEAVRRDCATATWLDYEAVKRKVETHSLVARQPLPVNSLDVAGASLVFGGDNEAFYVLNNVLQ